MKGSDDFRQSSDGVGYRPAEHAGMQVGGRSLHDDFRARQTAQAVGKGGSVRSGHAGIGDNDDVAGQFIPVLLQEEGKTAAADFLLPFQQEDHVHGQMPAVLALEFLHAQNVGEQLAFVVRGSAGVNFAVAHFRFKGVGLPQLHRIHGLHVIMAVNQHGRPAFFPGAAPHHDGMPVRLVRHGFKSHAGELVHQPVRAVAHVPGMLLLRGDAGKP